MNKSELRKVLMVQRRQVQDKAERDTAIAEAFLSLPEWESAQTLLCYVSLPEEVSTERLIKAAWAEKKTVAVPVTYDDNTMLFYKIDSDSVLLHGRFGVCEPDVSFCEPLTDFSGSICVVPGLAFTESGFRLGYGKGYYDKFLKNYTFLSVGLCYNSFILKALPTEEHDIPVEMVVTEEQFFGGNYERL